MDDLRLFFVVARGASPESARAAAQQANRIGLGARAAVVAATENFEAACAALAAGRRENSTILCVDPALWQLRDVPLEALQEAVAQQLERKPLWRAPGLWLERVAADSLPGAKLPAADDEADAAAFAPLVRAADAPEPLAGTVCLVMIVRDEAHIIEQTLALLAEQVALSEYVVCDTGSLDDTPERVERFFAARNIPGRLARHEWRDFAHNRTLSLQEARRHARADYLLVFDADDSIEGRLPDLAAAARAHAPDAFAFKFGPAHRYERPLMLRRFLAARYESVLHEYLVLPDACETQVLQGDYFVVSGRGGARSRNPNKYLDDAQLLAREFERAPEHLKPRYAFYCAYAFGDANRPAESREWFERRLQLGGFEQEKYYACYKLGHLYLQEGRLLDAVHAWTRAHEFDPERAECFCACLQALMRDGKHALAYAVYKTYKRPWRAEGKLFADAAMYDGRDDFYFSVSAYYAPLGAESRSEAARAVRRCLENDALDAALQELNMSNLRFHTRGTWKMSAEERMDLASAFAARALTLY